ncbi:MAG: phosphoglycerate kinase [Candidatus Taylorbacteria bacterium CG10_big_fil_rev_8_21_14_0_10_41_48]|uniref:Phosphoglycerate kinase n=1 Tax=Candidatus Taylorbacteria bacterium CG10_big_fil_rev_8_21_14_0_10_41_48 TaxID=1975024 RepID=A0A2M8LCZ4_9BACT|nr:MAG: phosphoglycerate kinase [Candidatus Taylorbacteria bacterium CG10_big_fil_rev_8_21_14_0_10_41_48]
MQTAFKEITNEKDLRGKRVLLRVDLNVPVVGDEVRDDFRIRAIFPTLEFLRNAGAKTIIIAHIENDVTDSLARVVSYISKFVEVKAFVEDLKSAPRIIETMVDGDIIALENLRKDPGEKENDPVFAGRLASLADIYVNDAFAASHRNHASIVSIPKLISAYAGPLFTKEVETLSESFTPPRPFLFILGGAKFDTKLPLIEKFLVIADYVFVGGALANDIFKERGFEVGHSVTSPTVVNLRHIESNPKLIIPVDVVVANPMEKMTKNPESVIAEDRIYDAGQQTTSELSDLLSDVKYVLWNGPLGDYEKGYTTGTETLARAIIASGAKSIMGGGDTVACVSKLGLLDKFSFVSTGGGAMLEFLAKGTLPGVDALKSNQ